MFVPSSSISSPQHTGMLLQEACAKNTEIFQVLRGIHFKVGQKESTKHSFESYFNEWL
jgi:hypothetical protein